MEKNIRNIVKEELHSYLCSNVGTDFWGYNLNRLSWLKAGMESVDFMIENLHDTYQSDNRLTHLTYILSHVKNNGLFLEFGVGHNGESIKVISENINDNIVYGFDTFRGLPEQWGNVLPKGAFYSSGKPPKLDSTNVVFVKGLFGDTLPSFVEEHKEDCAFLNIDCDLYSSTKTVFEHIGDRIKVGTVINFDEFFNYPGWQKHEYKAWTEFAVQRNIKFEYLSFVPNDMCVAIMVAEIGN